MDALLKSKIKDTHHHQPSTIHTMVSMRDSWAGIARSDLIQAISSLSAGGERQELWRVLIKPGQVRCARWLVVEFAPLKRRGNDLALA